MWVAKQNEEYIESESLAELREQLIEYSDRNSIDTIKEIYWLDEDGECYDLLPKTYIKSFEDECQKHLEECIEDVKIQREDQEYLSRSLYI